MRIAKLTALAVLLSLPGLATAQAPAGMGTEEFGLTERELVQAIEQVEGHIARCMREEGFQYVAADHATVRAGMAADKKLGELNELQFIARHGYGVSTLYTGLPPQLSAGYSPARVGLGERNVQLFRGLSPADQVAYNRALLGPNSTITFAMGLEIENFAGTGGCTRKAVEQVFKPEQLTTRYYNPQDALVNADPRMRVALAFYAREMRRQGFDYTHPDQVEADIRARLMALTNGGTLLVTAMSNEQRASLRQLQDYERRAAAANFKLQEEVITPVEERIQQGLFARPVQ